MKTFNEWIKENTQPQMRPGQMYPNEKVLNCPICNTQTVEKRHDYESGQRYSDIWQCSKCFTYWNTEKLSPDDAHKAAHLIG